MNVSVVGDKTLALSFALARRDNEYTLGRKRRIAGDERARSKKSDRERERERGTVKKGYKGQVREKETSRTTCRGWALFSPGLNCFCYYLRVKSGREVREAPVRYNGDRFIRGARAPPAKPPIARASTRVSMHTHGRTCIVSSPLSCSFFLPLDLSYFRDF